MEPKPKIEGRTAGTGDQQAYDLTEVLLPIIDLIPEIYVRSLHGTKFLMLVTQEMVEMLEDGGAELAVVAAKTREWSERVNRRRRQDIGEAVEQVLAKLIARRDSELDPTSARKWERMHAMFALIAPSLLRHLAEKLDQMEKEVIIDAVAAELRQKQQWKESVYRLLAEAFVGWEITQEGTSRELIEGKSPEDVANEWLKRPERYEYLDRLGSTAQRNGQQDGSAPSPLAARFRELADRWYDETSEVSSTTDQVLHGAYQDIIGLGPGAVPLILGELQKTGGHWFWALRHITGENPVSADDAGRVGRMREAWLNWGRERGFV